MLKFANEIENELTFALSGESEKLLHEEKALEHLAKAAEIFEKAGLHEESDAVAQILQEYAGSHGDIEVEL
jgi:hypothetical protein